MSTNRSSRVHRLQQIRSRDNNPSSLNESNPIDSSGNQTGSSSSSIASSAPASHSLNSNLQNAIPKRKLCTQPSLEPYVGKLERFELFCTHQCYYLVGCDKLNSAYRVLKIDRTLIEVPETPQASPHSTDANNAATTAASNNNGNTSDTQTAAMADAAHKSKPTLRPLSDFLTEDPNVYSQSEIQEMLDMIHDGNRTPGERSFENASSGGLKPLVKAYGIVGFIRFLDCYYLTLITRRAKVGSIGLGNGVYTIKNTETFPLKPAERNLSGSEVGAYNSDPSRVLLSMWNRGKRSVGLGLTNREIAELRYQGLYQVVDLTKNFFFSYTYDLTRSLQENFLATTSQPFPPPPFKDMFAWNFFLTRELEGCCNSLTSYHWVLPIIHGAFIQRKLNDYGRSLSLILLARRSRHFAGTRYLKRGVSEQGKVANDVEHEQILHDESKSSAAGTFSSFLQNRGSIPTFWTQESSVTMPKPPIEINRVDPTYTATQLHFEDLLKRYGSPVVVLDLVKQSEKREREVRVGNEFRHAIDYINSSIDDTHKIRYCALDYSHISKHRHLDVSTSLNEVSTWAVNQTGFFCSAPKWKILKGGQIKPFDEEDTSEAAFLTEQLGVPVFPMEQKGVLRTNCIDCLDRTNVAQFSAGVEAVEQQLVVMGIRSSAKLDPSSNIVRVLIDMYVDIGDHIALQYGGSEAHKKVSAEGRSESIITGPMGKHKELLTSIRRYYSNAFTDRLKQDAMNLFLGYYVPYRHTIPLWEMETDYYLHNFHVQSGKGMLHSMKAYQRAFGIDWNNDDADFAAEKESVTTAASVGLSTPPSSMRKRTQFSQLSRVSKAVRSKSWQGSLSTQHEESWRIRRVRSRCEAQNEALSIWWKAAIQSNLQQRMWMQLGSGPTESLLPPRFERLYQPDKVAQFDRFFARSWAVPVRRTHSAQHSEGNDDESDTMEFRRTISGGKVKLRKRSDEPSENISLADPDEKKVTKRDLSLAEYCSEYGFEPRVASSLKRFIKPHGIQDEHNIPAVGSADEKVAHVDKERPQYIGSTILTGRQVPAEYMRYLSAKDETSSAGRQYRPEAVAEFRKCLQDLSLDADDVDGVRQLAESAHIGKTIVSGPYRGLDQDQSAVEVATVIHELGKMRSKGDFKTELQRRGFFTDGVKEAMQAGWKQEVSSEKQYAEIVRPVTTPSSRRSDITTAESLKLYCSLFDESTSLTSPDLIFLLGEKPEHTATSPKAETPLPKSTFAAKAARLGFSVAPYTDSNKNKSAPLFRCEQRDSIPQGFEQINDDMFARRDNKFMVFNGAAVDCWQPQPVTKIGLGPGLQKHVTGKH